MAAELPGKIAKQCVSVCYKFGLIWNNRALTLAELALSLPGKCYQMKQRLSHVVVVCTKFATTPLRFF